MKKKCEYCTKSNAVLKRPKTGKLSCVECFNKYFELEIHETILKENLFNKDNTQEKKEKVIIGISGGKDSTVLAFVINKLNKQYNYNLDINLIAIDEGIKGYRDGSIQTIVNNSKILQLPLKIFSFKELYGYTMDEIVLKCGLENSCTYCGVFRRHALDHSALLIGCNKIITGHNADDIGETVLMNFLRGDFNRLPSSVHAITEGNENEESTLLRVKPFKYTFEKEIVMYAHYNKLEYFCTECTYAKGAYRGNVRNLIKDLELLRPQSIIDIIHSGEYFKIDNKIKTRDNLKCENCGHISSNKKCKTCLLLEKLKINEKSK